MVHTRGTILEWVVVDYGSCSAAENMSRDRNLFVNNIPGGPTFLSFYGWDSPAITYGHFARPRELLKYDGSVQIVKRPTGGGITIHYGDLPLTILIPRGSAYFCKSPQETYLSIHKALCKALHGSFEGSFEVQTMGNPNNLPLCSSNIEIGDIMHNGKKVVGASLSKNMGGYLYQGSIFMEAPPIGFLSKIFLDGKVVWTVADKFTNLTTKNNTMTQQLLKFNIERALIA